MQTAWDVELAEFLADLTAVQDDTLKLLATKRQMLVESDADGLAELWEKDEEIIGRLQQCLTRREELLKMAADQGLPSDSIRSLAVALPKQQGDKISDKTNESICRARLLQHQSLTNWVIAQKTLIHLSQMIEIIATGGRLQPTYGRGNMTNAGGTLVDRAA